MCRKEESGIAERTMFVNIDRDIDRLSHELACLIDLGALSTEENEALTAFLADLRTLLVRARQAEAQADTYLPKLSPMARLLAADLDLAYQRLSYAA